MSAESRRSKIIRTVPDQVLIMRVAGNKRRIAEMQQEIVEAEEEISRRIDVTVQQLLA